MSVEYTPEGYWLACHSHNGIRCIAEAETQEAAEWAVIEMLAERLAQKRLAEVKP